MDTGTNGATLTPENTTSDTAGEAPPYVVKAPPRLRLAELELIDAGDREARPSRQALALFAARDSERRPAPPYSLSIVDGLEIGEPTWWTNDTPEALLEELLEDEARRGLPRGTNPLGYAARALFCAAGVQLDEAKLMAVEARGERLALEDERRAGEEERAEREAVARQVLEDFARQTAQVPPGGAPS